MAPMHDLTDDERKEALGELLMDELKVIREYLQDLPAMKRDLHDVKETVARIEAQQHVTDAVVRAHDDDLKELRQQAA